MLISLRKLWGITRLKAAADKGWADIAAGRYYDIEDKDLDSFMEQIEAEVDEAIRSQG